MTDCKHSRVDIEAVRGRCRDCGYEIKSAQMKKAIAADRQNVYRAAFGAGYAKGLEDAKGAQAAKAKPIKVQEVVQ